MGVAVAVAVAARHSSPTRFMTPTRPWAEAAVVVVGLLPLARGQARAAPLLTVILVALMGLVKGLTMILVMRSGSRGKGQPA